MVKQFLLNADGSIPDGVDVKALVAARVRMVVPSARPAPAPGMELAESAVLDGLVWRQVWEQVPIVPRTLSAQQVEALRAEAYRQEADPLYFQFQRGEATRADWLAKVDEIRARYPKV